MSTWRVQHSIQDVDQLSESRYVNTFHFTHLTVQPTPTELNQLASIVRGFYTVAAGSNALNAYYASHAGGENSTCKVYKDDNALRHEPVASQTFTFPAPGSGVDNMPGEVALVLSYKSTTAPDVPLGRTRGRCYIGPLNASTQETGNEATPCRPGSVFIADILAAAQDMRTVAAAAGFTWVVHSPTLMKALALTSDFPVTTISVDNAYDTQRRRGVDASARTTITLP